MLTPEMDCILSEIAMVWPWAISRAVLSNHEWEFLYVILGTERTGTNSPGVDHAASYGANLSAESEVVRNCSLGARRPPQWY